MKEVVIIDESDEYALKLGIKIVPAIKNGKHTEKG
jgi:hypothetical protein